MSTKLKWRTAAQIERKIKKLELLLSLSFLTTKSPTVYISRRNAKVYLEILKQAKRTEDGFES